jgi:polysaccharide deacetylase 2 family uncharacterized protein YibQ
VGAQRDSAAPPGAQAPSWLALGLWFAALGLAAALCAVLLWAFFRSRPIDLTVQTDALADQVVRVLEAQLIPRDAIRREEPVYEVQPEGRWSVHRFNIDVPPRLDPAGLKAIVRRDLLAHHVHASDATLDGAAGLVLRLADFPFAEVRFLTDTAAAPRQTDLRPSIGRMVREVDRIVAELGVDSAAIRATAPVEMLDDEARWTHTTRAFPLPADPGPGELRARIEEQLAARDIRATSEPAAFGATRITIAFAGKACMELLCEPEGPPAAAPAEAPPPPLPPADTPAPTSDTEAMQPMPPQAPQEADVPLDRLLEGEPEPPVPPGPRADPEAGPARVAIILDDGGYGGAHSEQILTALDPGLTLAILPNTPYAGETARRGRERGFEIMLHMPMETHGNGDNPFPGEITTAMETGEIQRLTRAAIAQITGLVGVNNHTGSKFTSDPGAMRAFLPVVKELDLYFIDSFTLAGSVALDVAREMGVPTARRDVFIDNEKDPAYIRGQLDELITRAKSRGSAIGIGHFRPNTVEVLAAFLPTLAEQGVRLVHASELVR